MTQTDEKRPGQGASQDSLTTSVEADLIALEAAAKAYPVRIGPYSPAQVREILALVDAEKPNMDEADWLDLRDAYLAEAAEQIEVAAAALARQQEANCKSLDRRIERSRLLPAPMKSHRISGPNDPMKVARDIATEYDNPIRYWRGDFYEYVGTHYSPMEGDTIKSWLWRVTEAATYMHQKPDGSLEPRPWAPTKKKIADLEEALSKGVLLYGGEAERPIALRNGVLDNGALLPHSPERFNLASLPFDYDPAAEPRHWLAFLASTLPDDYTAHDFLQEWFGYVISGRTDKHTMACLIGKSRAGKGVIVSILEDLLGHENVTGITLDQLASQFGKGGLIGKSLATISEPRWASREAGEAVEPILRITGGDRIQIDRKYRDEWIGHLGTRLMIVANDPPRLVNRTGALANRMMHVRFTVSFAGREDYGLTDRLRTELPGIFNWAMAGLKRLESNDRFTVPDSHQALQEKFREHADPDAGFLEAKCELGQGLSASEAEVFAAYQEWCQEGGRRNDSTTSMALRHRLTERDGITARRVGRAKTWRLEGLTVPAHVEPFDSE